MENITCFEDEDSSRDGNISQRYTFNYLSSDDVAAILESFRKDSKVILSEYLWLFLFNDTNYFLQYLYGLLQWSDLDLEKSRLLFQSRRKYLSERNSVYLKFIVPEKEVIYSEYLPKVLHAVEKYNKRPACLLSSIFPDGVYYPLNYLIEGKTLGNIYFRGDSHLNWLGSVLLYQYIVRKLRNVSGIVIPKEIGFQELLPSLYGYDGDLFVQLHPEDKKILLNSWPDLQFQGNFEKGVKYTLPEATKRAKQVGLSEELRNCAFHRQTIVMEQEDPSLPTAVIFRDSTSEFIIDLLAQHFRRAVFIWYQGEVLQKILDWEKPDVVLHIMAERFVRSYPSRNPFA